MVAAHPLPAETAGLPGHCALCGKRASRCLCQPCRRAHTDPATGTLAPWVAELQREANRQAMAIARNYRRWRGTASEKDGQYQGLWFISYEDLLEQIDIDKDDYHDNASGNAIALRMALLSLARAQPPVQYESRGVTPGPWADDPGRAPSLADWLAAHPDHERQLRRYSPSGVPLDMRDFVALLDLLFGWPPPGTTADPGHREELVDLYERVYPA